MAVSKRLDKNNRATSWQVYWRCNGQLQLSIRVRVSALNGDHDAAERVAGKLQAHIEAANDRSDKVAFTAVLDELIAAELEAQQQT